MSFARAARIRVTMACVLACVSCLGHAQAARPLLFDTHAHFFTDDFADYPLHAEHAYMGKEKLIETIRTRPDTPDYLIELWHDNGVESGVGVQYNAAYETDNRYLLAVSHAYPASIVPVVMLDTHDPAAPQTLRDLATRDGIAGIRLTGPQTEDGQFPWLDSPDALKVWQVANDLHLAVVVFPSIHVPDSHAVAAELMPHVAALAQRFPHTKIVLDHVGWPAPEGPPDYGVPPVYAALSTQTNVYFKVTSLLFNRLKSANVSTAEFVRHVVDVFGADRVMWGSDQGNTLMPYKLMVQEAFEATALLNPAEKAQVLHDTGYRVFRGDLNAPRSAG